MKKSTNYGFNLPEVSDFYDVEHTNSNFEAVDRELKALADSTETKASQTAVDNIQTTSKATLSQAGWYRVAEYKGGSSSGVLGNRSNSCKIILRRTTSSNSGTYKINLNSRYDNQEFEVESVDIKTHVLTKIRYVYDNTYTAYIEVYNATTDVKLHVTVLEGVDDTYKWQAITPTLTAETVDGVTVTTTYDIPSNASPVTDLDLVGITEAQRMPTGTDLNTCYKSGLYYFDGDVSGGKFLNIPNEYAHNGIMFVGCNKPSNIGNNERLFQLYFSANQKKAYFRTCLGVETSWYEWKEIATTADLANYFKNTGGEINGGDYTDVLVNSNSGNSTVRIKNPKREIWHRVDANGYYQIYDKTNGKDIITSNPDGSVTYAGGTVNGNISATSSEAKSRAITLQNAKRRIQHQIIEDGRYRLADITNGKEIISSTADGTVTYASGEFNGSITQARSGASVIRRTLKNGVREIQEYIADTGAYLFADVTNGKVVYRSDADGTNTFNGTASGNLPLVGGGTLTGDTPKLAFDNGEALGWLIANGGYIGLYNGKASDWVFTSKVNGTNEFRGTATGNLPLTGGEITSPSGIPLTLDSLKDNSSNYLCFKKKGELLGYLGFISPDLPAFYSDTHGAKKLLHEGNYTDYTIAKNGGGEITKGGYSVITLNNTYGKVAFTGYKGEETQLGYLGMIGVNEPCFKTADGSTNHALLHTGNSAKVLVQSTPLTEAGSIRVW